MIQDNSGFTILVIEDNPGDFALVGDFLRDRISRPGIVHVGNFDQASSILSADTYFDVILLDLTLPDKKGTVLVTEILKMASGCPVIILTGFSDIDFSIHTISLGIADYLLKDELNPNTLYKSISYCMERKKHLLALKESENRYSSLFQLSPQPMWVYNLETSGFVQVNDAAIEHYGYSEAEFLKMKIMDICVEEKGNGKEEPADQDGEKNVLGFRGKIRHKRKSKEPIEVDMYSNPIILNNRIFGLVIAVDITEKILFEHSISRAIIKTQEDEQYEIGSELHDNVCQILATTGLNLGMMKESLSPPAMEWFDRCAGNLNLVSDEIRNLSHRLAPALFNHSSLEDTFTTLLNTFDTGTNYKISLHVANAVAKYPLSRDIRVNLYRILQEQLRNISKYANAKSIDVIVIIHDHKLKMGISDDGIGFDLDAAVPGIGLANMKRRVELFSGKLEIYASSGKGCEITVAIPLAAEAQTVSISR